MGDSALLRLGGAAGVVSAVVAVVFNAIHPRATSRSLNDVGELLRIVSASGSWRPVHLASVAAVLLGALAVVAILWSMLLHGSTRWPVVALVSLVLTTPVLLLSVTTDGFAIKAVADRWAHAGAGERETMLAAATAVRNVDVALVDVEMMAHFGLTAILVGVASWTSGLYPRTLAAVAVAGGVLGVVCGASQAWSGRLTPFSYLVLLTVSLALFTVWLLMASVVLWSRAERATSRATGMGAG